MTEDYQGHVDRQIEVAAACLHRYCMGYVARYTAQTDAPEGTHPRALIDSLLVAALDLVQDGLDDVADGFDANA